MIRECPKDGEIVNGDGLGAFCAISNATVGKKFDFGGGMFKNHEKKFQNCGLIFSR
jgi:hypothetical protein